MSSADVVAQCLLQSARMLVLPCKRRHTQLQETQPNKQTKNLHTSKSRLAVDREFMYIGSAGPGRADGGRAEGGRF